jgi:hypothetical protein
MRSFLFNYANGITILNGESIYIDALQNFTYDCANAGLSLIPQVSDDVYEYMAVDSQNPNDSYAKTRQFGQMGFNATGRKPSDYFSYINNIQKIIDEKRKRTHD